MPSSPCLGSKFLRGVTVHQAVPHADVLLTYSVSDTSHQAACHFPCPHCPAVPPGFWHPALWVALPFCTPHIQPHPGLSCWASHNDLMTCEPNCSIRERKGKKRKIQYTFLSKKKVMNNVFWGEICTCKEETLEMHMSGWSTVAVSGRLGLIGFVFFSPFACPHFFFSPPLPPSLSPPSLWGETNEHDLFLQEEK